MLKGQATVFLSCSERFKSKIALPVRQALRVRGVFAVIVSEEPLLPRTAGDPDSKVESYLDASDAFVALCTPDDELGDGAIQCRQNVIDELQRARQKPHLRGRVQVFKEPSVHLPSNTNPTYESLDLDNVEPVTELVVRQLEAWGILGRPPERMRPASIASPAALPELIDGLPLGDHEEAARRAYRLLRTESRQAQHATVEELRQFLRDTTSESGDEVLRVSSVLEAMNRLDPTLVSVEMIEELADSEDFTKRSSAAMLLWELAEVAPAEVPLGLLGRLAIPSSEDWYVHAPAMAAAKLLLLHRQAARVIFDDLARSPDPEDRHAVATALLDIAEVDLTVIPRDLAKSLASDHDELVAGKAQQLLKVLGDRRENQRDPRSPFGL